MGLRTTCSDSALHSPLAHSHIPITHKDDLSTLVHQKLLQLVETLYDIKLSQNDATKPFQQTLFHRASTSIKTQMQKIRRYSSLDFRNSIEALLLANSNKQPAYPGNSSTDYNYFQSLSGVIGKINRVLEEWNLFVQCNHDFIYHHQSLSEETVLNIISCANEFSVCILEGSTADSEQVISQGEMSDVAVQVFSERLVVKKTDRGEHYDDDNTIIEEAFKALSLNSQQVEKPIALGKDSAYYELEENGDLSSVLNNQQEMLTAQNVLTIITNVAHALCAAHEKQLVHRNVTPENIFITHSFAAKLGGFGLAKTTEEISNLCFPVNGVLEYRAPELLPGSIKNGYNEKIDVWSFGVLVMEIILGELPIPLEYQNIGNQLQQYIAAEERNSLLTFLERTLKAQEKYNELHRSLTGWIKDTLSNRNLLTNWIEEQKRKSPSLAITLLNRDPTAELLNVALSCLKKDPHERPTMTEVLDGLSRIA